MPDLRVAVTCWLTSWAVPTGCCCLKACAKTVLWHSLTSDTKHLMNCKPCVFNDGSFRCKCHGVAKDLVGSLRLFFCEN